MENITAMFTWDNLLTGTNIIIGAIWYILLVIGWLLFFFEAPCVMILGLGSARYEGNFGGTKLLN